MNAAVCALVGWVAGVILGAIPFVRAYRGLAPFQRTWLRLRPAVAPAPDAVNGASTARM